MGISEPTFYNWKKKYSGVGVTELRRLPELEQENGQLKKIVADLSLDKQMLQDILKKSFKGGSKTGVGPLPDGELSSISSTILSNR